MLIWLDKGRKVTLPGKLFALYVALYCLGRIWIEALRIDQAHYIAGIRLNDWVSALVGAGAVAILIRRRSPVESGNSSEI